MKPRPPTSLPLIPVDGLVPRVPLKTIAQATGLSRSGVSRALHNDPRVPPKTCQQVQRLAQKLGYRPDPELSSAFRLLSQRKTSRYIETIAFFSWHSDRIEKAGNLYTKRLFQGARAHAEALGYRMEEYWVFAPGMTSRRLQTILSHRGVRGCLISPLVRNLEDFDFEWNRFSVVAATASFPEKILHRARVSNYDNTRLALTEVHKLGYHRIGLLIDDYIQNRSAHAIQAAFLEDNYVRRVTPGIPILELEGLGPDPGPESLQTNQFTRFKQWYKKHRPDIILSSRVNFHSWLLQSGLNAPRDVGFVSLEGINEDETFTHIDQHPDRVGAAGVDLLISVLNRNERGIPSHPFCTTVAGTWMPGTSTHPTV